MKPTITTNRSNAIEHNSDDLSRIAKGAGITLVGKIIGTGIQFIYLIMIARILGSKIFGLYTLGFTIISLVGVISRLGLEMGVVKYVSKYKGINESGKVKGTIVSSLKFSFILAAVLAFILFVTSDSLFSKAFNKPELGEIIRLLSISIPFLSLMTIALYSTQGFTVMKYTVYCQNLFVPLCNIFLVIILYLIGFKLLGVVMSCIISTFFASCLSIYYLIKTFPKIKHTKAVSETKELFVYSIPLLLSLLLISLIMWTDTLMLGYFKSSNEVGIYYATMKTSLLTGMILLSFNSIFAPVISDLYNKMEIQRLESLFQTSTKWIYTLSFPFFLLIVILSGEILLIFGEDFALGQKALVILSFAQLVNAAAGSVGVMLSMSGYQKLMLYNSIVMCLLNIVLNCFLIPAYGMTGASIASGISISIFNIVMLLEVKVLLKIHPYNFKYLKPTVSGIVTFGILFFLKYKLFDLHGIYGIIIITVLFLLIYSGFIVAYDIDEEDKLILNLFKKKAFQKFVL